MGLQQMELGLNLSMKAWLSSRECSLALLAVDTSFWLGAQLELSAKTSLYYLSRLLDLFTEQWLVPKKEYLKM